MSIEFDSLPEHLSRPSPKGKMMKRQRYHPCPCPESGGCVAFYRYANEPCYTWVSHHLSSTAVSQSLDPSEQSNLWEPQGINLSDDRYSQKKGLPHKYAPNFTKKV